MPTGPVKFFIGLIFGHLVGDYFFQNNWQALSKNKSLFRCFIHCLLYTGAVALFTWKFHPLWLCLVFVSHFPIDYWSLGDKWLQFIRGRSFKWFMSARDLDNPLLINPKESDSLAESVEKIKHRELRAGFTTAVYLVVDNTMHLAIMWYGYIFLLKKGLI